MSELSKIFRNRCGQTLKNQQNQKQSIRYNIPQTKETSVNLINNKLLVTIVETMAITCAPRQSILTSHFTNVTLSRECSNYSGRRLHDKHRSFYSFLSFSFYITRKQIVLSKHESYRRTLIVRIRTSQEIHRGIVFS